MQYLGVISGPGKRSLSPVFQQAALDALQLDLVYEHWPTPPDGLAVRVQTLRSPNVLGANVTIPHKQAIIPLLDETDALAHRVGAVNTVLNQDGRLHGYNTDVEGFLRALREDAAFDPRGRRCVIAGAGGAARAVVVALQEAAASEVTIVNRTLARAEGLLAELNAEGDAWLRALPDTPDAWREALEGAGLLVNCTSLGAAGTPEENDSPVAADLISPDLLVYDLVYVPAETSLLRAAQARSARTLGGLPMLIYQGAASFRIWTDRDPPLDTMFKAAQAALAEAAA